MKKRIKKSQHHIPRFHRRQEMVVDFLKKVGKDIADFNPDNLPKEYILHNLVKKVDNLFFGYDCKLSYPSCISDAEKKSFKVA